MTDKPKSIPKIKSKIVADGKASAPIPVEERKDKRSKKLRHSNWMITANTNKRFYYAPTWTTVSGFTAVPSPVAGIYTRLGQVCYVYIFCIAAYASGANVATLTLPIASVSNLTSSTIIGLLNTALGTVVSQVLSDSANSLFKIQCTAPAAGGYQTFISLAYSLN